MGSHCGPTPQVFPGKRWQTLGARLVIETDFFFDDGGATDHPLSQWTMRSVPLIAMATTISSKPIKPTQPHVTSNSTMKPVPGLTTRIRQKSIKFCASIWRNWRKQSYYTRSRRRLRLSRFDPGGDRPLPARRQETQREQTVGRICRHIRLRTGALCTPGMAICRGEDPHHHRVLTQPGIQQNTHRAAPLTHRRSPTRQLANLDRPIRPGHRHIRPHLPVARRRRRIQRPRPRHPDVDDRDTQSRIQPQDRPVASDRMSA